MTDNENIDDILKETEDEELVQELSEDAGTEAEEEAAEEIQTEIPADEDEGTDPPAEELTDELTNKLEELNDKYVRLYADFENYKKRTAKEKTEIYAHANIGLVEKLLAVLDSFGNALKEQDEKNTAVYEGFVKVSKQLNDILTAEGLQIIPAAGEKFDPNIHHAVAADSSDEYEDNVITEEFMSGYLFKDKVIRPSMVKVNKR